MAEEKLVGYDALAAIASDIKTDIGTKADASTTYNKTEVDTALSAKADKSDTYTKAQVDSAVGAKADASSVYTKTQTDDLLAGKADTDGSYDNMTVGNAKQLVSKITETDKVPYLFRPSGGSIDIGDRETDMIVGGTVAFNQLVQNNDTKWRGYRATISYDTVSKEFTVTKNDNESGGGLYSISLFSDYPQNHKTLIMLEAKSVDVTAFRIYLNSAYKTNNILTPNYTQYSAILNSGSPNEIDFYTDGGNNNSIVYYKNIQVIDLTAMFGTTIADYIYSLEQSVAGSGVAWFRNLFPKSYYAYNAGTLMSVQTSKHITTGFNQWDEEWELGTINAQGQNASGNQTIRSKNYIPILPNTAYYITNVMSAVFWYDYDKNLISLNYSGGLRTSPTNAYYMRFYSTQEYGNTYNHDICINFHWDGERDGEYEPYVKYEYDYSGEREVTRYFTLVDLGTLNWKLRTEYQDRSHFEASLSGGKLGKTYMVCPKYVTWYSTRASAPDKTIFKGNLTDSGTLMIRDDSYTNAATFKTAMSGVYLVYELLTPFDETVSNPELRGIPMLDGNNKLYYYGDTCEDFTNPQIVNDFGTEEYVDTREVPIPVGHETEYQPNLRAKLEMAPDSPDGDGDYLVRQTSGVNEYVALTKELPALPNEDGTYSLKGTVSGGTKTLSWVADE